jgi:hypothetical protein
VVGASFQLSIPYLMYLGWVTRKDVQVLLCMHLSYRGQDTCWLDVGLSVLGGHKKSLVLLSSSGEPVCFMLLGNHMLAKQQSL